MDKLFSILKLHALAIMAFVAAFLFWKDYFTKPHQHLDKTTLSHITGTLSQAGTTLSLPTGYSTGNYIIIKEANTTFIPAGIKWSMFVDEVPEGATITMSYDPQENPKVAGKGIDIFSLKYNDKEYFSEPDDVTYYNKNIDKRRNTAIYATLAGFLAVIVVELIRRRFLK
ncbi:MAG: hypothetical protein U0U67_13955 [Chitinophagales bacterium]